MNLGVYVAQFGATVVMVDFDLEAPGLHYKIQPGSMPIDVTNRGLAGLLADATVSTSIADLNYDLALDVTKHVESPPLGEDDLEQARGRLLLIPAGDPLTSGYWTDLARIDWGRLFTESPRPGVTALACLRDYIIETYNPDLLLIDSRTGITPSAGVSTTLLPDVVVTLLLNTPEHLDGSRIVVSAIARGEAGDVARARVQPVLSRYTGGRLTEPVPSVEARRRAAALPGRTVTADELPADDIPIDEVRETLIAGLDEEAASQVAAPLVLHTDIALQQRERLSFGRYAREMVPGASGTLLDDYLRLFASLVPREMVTRHLAGVRNRIRAIILDRPEDAVQTLENLAGLVGDEGVFIDLIKVHALRRDVVSMLRAAERLFRVHSTIVVNPAISGAIRDHLSVGRPQRGGPETIRLPGDFLESYWRRAAPDDADWGIAVVRALAAMGSINQAERLGEELILAADAPEVLAQIVRALTSGNSESEQVAVQLAMRHFDSGKLSSEFLRAAAAASTQQPLPELAVAIADSAGFASLPDVLAVEVLYAAGRYDEAAALLLETLATLDANDPSFERRSLDRTVASWTALTARSKDLRTELQQRNPRVAEYLDSFRDDSYRPREMRRRY